jgi:hypothetical protein
MKIAVALSVSTLLSLATPALAHDLFRVSLEPMQEGQVYGPGAFGLDFYLIDNKLERVMNLADVTSGDLRVHVYDEDLGGIADFQAHWVAATGTWHTDLNLAYKTTYWVWAEGMLSGDQEPFLGGGSILVGGNVPLPDPGPLSASAEGQDSGSRVDLGGAVVAQKPATLTFKFSRLDGSPAVITDLELFVATDDADGLYRLTPSRFGDGSYDADFTAPEAGLYRVWARFTDGRQARLVRLAFNASP